MAVATKKATSAKKATKSKFSKATYLGWYENMYRIRKFEVRFGKMISLFSILSIVIDLYKDINGKIWVGTNGLVHILDPITMTIERIYDPITKTYPQALFDIINQKIQSGKTTSEIVEVGNSQDLTIGFNITKPRDYLIVSAGEGMPSDSAMSDFGNNDKILIASLPVEKINTLYTRIGNLIAYIAIVGLLFSLFLTIRNYRRAKKNEPGVSK